MKTILYPTRGGQSSYPNQDVVIALAKEQNARLIFLYISSVQFLEKLGHVNHTEFVEEQLEDMGEFLLTMARERAEKAGWQAESIVRQGAFLDAVNAIMTEQKIDTLVVGAPGSSHAVTTNDFLQNVSVAIQENYPQTEVLVIRDGVVDKL